MGFDIATLVPSQRDFLQAVRTGREGLALVPCLASNDAGREALRMAEEGVSAIAMSEPSPAMTEASLAMRVPVLSLRLVTSRDGALLARASGADAIIVDPKVDDVERREIASSARSVHMAALFLTTTREEAEQEARAGARALIVKGPSVASIREQIAGAPRVLAIAWLTPEGGGLATSRGATPEEDLRALRGLADAAIVGVDVYGVTGFERLVSELNP